MPALLGDDDGVVFTLELDFTVEEIVVTALTAATPLRSK